MSVTKIQICGTEVQTCSAKLQTNEFLYHKKCPYLLKKSALSRQMTPTHPPLGFSKKLKCLPLGT